MLRHRGRELGVLDDSHSCLVEKVGPSKAEFAHRHGVIGLDDSDSRPVPISCHRPIIVTPAGVWPPVSLKRAIAALTFSGLIVQVVMYFIASLPS